MRPAPRPSDAEMAAWRVPRGQEATPTPNLATEPDSSDLRVRQPQPVKPAKKTTRVRKRRVLAVVGLLFLLPLVVLGVQGYRIIDAIGQAQRSAVIPLPTRVPRQAGSVAQTIPTATADATLAAPSPTPVADPAVVAAAPTSQPEDGTAGPNGTAPPATATAAPTEVAPAAAPTSEPALPVVAAADDGSGDSPSAFDVMRALAQAGTDRGDPGQDEVWQGQTSITIMVLGVDRRPDGGDQNADVIILARLDLIEKEIHAVSIPRDLLVDIPGYGQGKINGAYNLGMKANPGNPISGVAMMRDTLEDNFGVHIDDYVLVDFQGFEQVIDAVGGINLNVPTQIIDPAYPTVDYGTEVVEFDPGWQHMDGETALKYARTRNADSDDERRGRQFDVLLALFDQGKGIGSITNASEIILALGDSVQTSFALDEQLTLARLGFDMNRSAIHMTTLAEPMIEPGTSADGAWVYEGDIPTIATFVQSELGVTAAAGG